MKTISTLISALLFASVATAAPEAGSSVEKDKALVWTFTPDPALPNVLILGDSISIGYTLQVRELLQGKANVFRPMRRNRRLNCNGTGFGVANLGTWLAGQKWDVIHFNWGLHDLKHVKTAGSNDKSNDPNDPTQATLEEYAKNMETIVGKLKATGARLVFATTTPVVPGTLNPLRTPEAPVRYNAAALEIMEANDIRVNDLYAFCKPHLKEWQLPKNVHFKPAGSEALAKQVAAVIAEELGAAVSVPAERTQFIPDKVWPDNNGVHINAQSEPIQISGVYPHLTMYNNEGECGTGAVVPWAGKLWVITYGPHKPHGSSDKLYEITPELKQINRPESIGGTPANRMIHRESNQLFIGPYAITAEGDVRVIPVKDMPGRLTGNARHLTDPAGEIYYATMEEGLYSVDVDTLAVEEHIMDGNLKEPLQSGAVSKLPGYHGKGLYSGQGRVVYSNNGQRSKAATRNPTTPSGALAQWFGDGDWQLVRRNQFTEVTGPNGIYGSENPETDPIWAMGWDARSLLLGLLEDGEWSYYRLPKGSHSYDGAHGWNTEWPRIREIGEKDYLATMHGTFWRFPATFSRKKSAGIAPRSNYLKVIGDYCRWNDKVVLGCDDSAQKEFLNTRSFKAKHASPKQSNSNLWFIEPEQLDGFGPVIGRGSVWLRDEVKANTPSDPYLFSGYDHRQLCLMHSTPSPVTFTLEVDKKGTGEWTALRNITLKPNGTETLFFNADETGAWIRLTVDKSAKGVTAHFQYRNRDTRTAQNAPLFNGIATPAKAAATTGVMRSLAYNKLGIALDDGSYYEPNPQMEFTRVESSAKAAELIKAVAQPANSFSVDAASVIMEEDGKRYRFPKNKAYTANDGSRICREVATERDLLNLHGTFYELPARNAQGMAKIRPVATHNLSIFDYCSHSGLLFFTGIDADASGEHIFRSTDGKAAVWSGVVDDLWKLGKPRGQGGPWKDSSVKAGVPSDPYLMTAYDQKSVKLSAASATRITLEVDIDGTGLWVPYKTFAVEPGKPVAYEFPEAFSAYWVRATSDNDTTATVWFKYE